MGLRHLRRCSLRVGFDRPARGHHRRGEVPLTVLNGWPNGSTRRGLHTKADETMIKMIFGKLGGVVITALAAIALLASAFMGGRQVEQKAQEVEDLHTFVKTKERIDEVEVSPDSDAAFERLRRNGLIR